MADIDFIELRRYPSGPAVLVNRAEIRMVVTYVRPGTTIHDGTVICFKRPVPDLHVTDSYKKVRDLLLGSIESP